MTQYRMIRRVALTGALALPILTTGCGIFSQEASKQIDPPQNTSQNATGAANETAAGQAGATEQTTTQPTGTETAVQGDQTQLTVYLKDQHQLLAPVSVLASLEGNQKAGQKALELMVAEGPYAAELPIGFEAVLPKGTIVNDLTIEDDQKLAMVDLSSSFGNYAPEEERRIVEAVTWTLTSLPGVNKVQLSVDGVKLGEMPVDRFPLDEPLTRAVGINLEVDEGVDYSQSTPVTLYFSSVSPSDESYYVPVTRLIDRTDNKAKSAIQELIAGPLDSITGNGSLIPVSTPDVVVKSIEKGADVVSIALEDSAYVEGQKMPAELLEALVLSLTENTGIGKVQISINGSSNIMDTNNVDYSKPVSRPEVVNAIKS
ncbi:germination protein M [Paenibacillus phyllosphaerae]|uniref:Germination protein M n=1 Tax=Paenibacillus phyllosphaerae TaxID=274593 RepID=A0A7W5FM27_9BACL|nr:GerMN domain-containing protein [Paenibacillus phyllosphaerae]MBB3109855.1 germination protein M [Paenibacillus phyllosphaerae]